MYVVVGLGNPGRRYAATRHNVGFMVIERLAERWHIDLGRAAAGLRMGRGRFVGQPVALIEPQLYMNLSGAALSSILEPTAAELVVIHDDIDLACGQLRVKHRGGTGGHRGLESIVAWHGPEFLRVRVGVGRPAPDGDAAAYVLAPFAAEERPVIAAAIERAADAVESLVRDGVEPTMNQFNQRVRSVASRAN